MQPTSLSLPALLLFVLASCGEPASPGDGPEPLDLRFEQSFALGDTSLTAEEILLPSPDEVRTDSEHRIYIADSKLQKIQVYDREGTHLRSIGGPGNGPMEFSAISAMDFNSADELFVADSRNARITVFSTKGELISEINPPEGDLIWPAQMRMQPGRRFLILNKVYPNARPDEPAVQQAYLHFYDAEYARRVDSFAPVDTVLERDIPFLRHLTRTFSRGHLWAGENRAWYAPGVYEGRILEFGAEGEQWILRRVLEGRLLPDEPLDPNDESEDAVSLSVYSYSEGGGMSTYSALLRSESIGLFGLEDGRLLHISSQLVDTTRRTMAEVFSPEGELQGFGELQSLRGTKSDRSIDFAFVWRDALGRFYLLDERDIPVVRVGRILGL